jgi:hypothetical protein
MDDDTKTIPLCGTCNGWMIFCFAIDYKEWVCPKCGTGVEYFNNNAKEDVTPDQYEAFAQEQKPVIMALYERATR